MKTTILTSANIGQALATHRLPRTQTERTSPKMRTIKNRIITNILDEILQDVRAGKDDAEARKFGKTGECFMPFNIDFLFRDTATAPGAYRFAFSHYYRHPSGDMIPDPDMEVCYFPETGELAAMTYQDIQKYETTQGGEIGKPIDYPLQSELTDFLRTWLKNVVEQQGLDSDDPKGSPDDHGDGVKQFMADIKAGNRSATLPKAGKSTTETTPPAPDRLDLATFIERFKGPITANIHKRFAPIYDLSADTTQEDRLISQMQTRSAELGKPMFTAQEHVTKAAKKLLVDHQGKCVFVIGELGTGKTQIANSLTQIMQQTATRNLIICPPHLVRKWEREIRATMPKQTRLQVFQIRSISDFEKAKLQAGLYEKSFFIMSMERSKLSYYWKPSFDVKTVTVMNPDTKQLENVEMPYCPNCKEIITDPRTGAALEAHKLRNKKHWCRNEYPAIIQAGDNTFTEKTRKCKTPLWTADPGGPRRYALADYIAKRNKNFFDVFILDEAHKGKARNSAIGQAVGTLAGACKKTVLLTGTIFGGRSSSLFYLLYRFSPAFKKQFKYTEESAFVKKYGIQWKITRETETTEDGRSSKRKSSPVRIEEKPGISPEIILHMIDKAVFINLKDISETLPTYQEIPVEVQMTGRQATEYYAMEKAFRQKLVKALAKGDKRLLSVYLQTCLTFPDLPGEDPTELLPKEKALLDFILQERAAGRKTLIYCTHTDTRDITPRLKYVMQQSNIKAEVMKSTVKAETREAWIAEKVKTGIDVLICNPQLVETGLDLLEFPNIVHYETSFNIYTTRQASRRSWRIGQTEKVKVLFICYSKTMQERALALVAKKLKAAEMLDGDLQADGLSGFQDEGSILVDLAKSMLSGIQEDQTLQGIFNSKADAETDAGGFIGHDEPAGTPAALAAPEIQILTTPADIVQHSGPALDDQSQPDLWEFLYAAKLEDQAAKAKPRTKTAQQQDAELILRLF